MLFEDNIKELGTWDLKNPSTLDDYAYYVYCLKISLISDIKERLDRGSGLHQILFKAHFRGSPYYRAAKIVLRGEKIEKIKKRIADGI